jgi:(S)-ureidoglycine aminohydrolase
MQRGNAIVHIAPAAGAAFTQYTAELDPSGTLGPTPHQRFLYLLDGAAALNIGTQTHTLLPNGYAYIPAGTAHILTATEPARLAVIEKSYIPLDNTLAPVFVIGNESTIASTALKDDPDLQVRSLLPASPSYDFAVNTMAYNPGAALSQIEIHVMEHGLLMLEGGGIYRLGDNWYPVTAGDFIWMAPFCPQWFGALGKTPAKYLIYKDWNRPPA